MMNLKKQPQDTKREFLKAKVVLGLLGLFCVSLAFAEPAQLELNGKAKIERADNTEQSYSRTGSTTPINFSLGAGDRVCVTEGSGKLVYGVKAFALQSPGTACFEVAKPKGLWQNLVQSCQDIGVCKKEAEKAFVKEAKSRGIEGNAPIVYLPVTYSLASLNLTIAGGQTLRLLDDKNKEIQQLQSTADGIFRIPNDKLKLTTRIEVLNKSAVIVYAAPLRWVNIVSDISASAPREQALELWITQNISYAPAAYSYLLAAGDTELAKTLESLVRAEFRGSTR